MDEIIVDDLKRHRIKTMAWVLYTVGIDVRKKNMEITLKFVIFHFGVVCTTLGITLFAIKNRNDFEEAIITAAFFGSNVIINVAVPSLFRNRYKLQELILKMDENIFTYPDEDEIQVEYHPLTHEDRTKKVMILVFFYVWFGFSLSGLTPFVGLYLSGTFKTQMYPAWYPWKEDDFISASITYGIQMFTSTCIFWSFYLFQIFAVLVVIEFLRQYRRLSRALSLLPDRAKKLFVKKMFHEGAKVDWEDLNYINRPNSKFTYHQREVFNQIYRQKIIHCILHHQQLLKTFELFNSWYSMLFSVELVSSVVTFGFVFYNVLQVTDPERGFTIIGSSFNVLTNLFSRCLIGEILSGMNEKITETVIHEVNWYDQSLANQKLLVILHFLTKREHSIMGF